MHWLLLFLAITGVTYGCIPSYNPDFTDEVMLITTTTATQSQPTTAVVDPTTTVTAPPTSTTTSTTTTTTTTTSSTTTTTEGVCPCQAPPIQMPTTIAGCTPTAANPLDVTFTVSPTCEITVSGCDMGRYGGEAGTACFGWMEEEVPQKIMCDQATGKFTFTGNPVATFYCFEDCPANTVCDFDYWYPWLG